jgi:hypothetical protein
VLGHTSGVSEQVAANTGSDTDVDQVIDSPNCDRSGADGVASRARRVTHSSTLVRRTWGSAVSATLNRASPTARPIFPGHLSSGDVGCPSSDLSGGGSRLSRVEKAGALEITAKRSTL